MIINPEGFTFDAWAAAVSQQLGQAGDTVSHDPSEDWRDWATRICQLPQVRDQTPVRHDYYEAWPAWAYAFNRSVDY